MQEVDFFKLPRTVQDRILGGMRGEFPPMPLAKRLAPAAIPWHWAAMSAVGGVALVLLPLRGYGSLSAEGQHGVVQGALYALAAFASFAGVMGFLVATARQRLLPYPRGSFLYAGRILFTTSHPLRTLVLDSRAQFELQGNALRVTIDGKSETFDSELAAQLLAELREARELLVDGEDPELSSFSLAYDPLHEPRFSSPVGMQERREYREPGWMRWGWLVALGLALLIAPMVLAVRNQASDRRMFAVAKAADTVADYQTYLRVGVQHRDEVSARLLPSAELREAVALGTPDAIMAFERAHPDVQIGDEIADAKRRALLATLAGLEARGELTALQEFPSRYPQHGLDVEYNAAVRRAYANQETKLHGSSAEAVAQMVAALGRAREHGPRARLEWRQQPSTTLTNLEKVLVRVPEYQGPASKPSRYVDEAAQGERAKTLLRSLSADIAGVIPVEYIEFTPDAPADSAATLKVTENVEWSGYALRSRKPAGVLVGLVFKASVELSVPGAGAPYTLQLSVIKKPTLGELKPYERDRDAMEPGVYGRMVAEFHAELVARVHQALLDGSRAGSR